MAKKQYKSPILMTMTPDDDPTIPFGGSQGTEGVDSMWTWDESVDELIGMFDDTELEAMDTDHNYHITEEEFYAYYGN